MVKVAASAAAPPEPVLEASGLRVIDLVRTAYGEGVEAATALTSPPLETDALRTALDYCAAQACLGDALTCAGCRLRSEAEGITSLDDFSRRFARIEAGPVALTGPGEGTLAVPSLDDLARSWQGEEVWFLARRVLRRLVKESDARKAYAVNCGAGAAPTFILVAPQMAENIGMVARAMANFALPELRLVNPRDGWPNQKARAAASGAHGVIDEAHAHPTTRDAIGDLHWIAATTARQRELAKPVMSFEQATAEMRRRMAEGQRCGVLFGPERTGLESDDVALADAIVMAPVNPRFASINLAQAVLLMGYEWYKGRSDTSLGRVTDNDAPGVAAPHHRLSRPATREELIGFLDHLERELDAQGFLHPPHKRPTMVRNMRTMFERMEPTEQEVRTLRGIVAALVHGKRWGRKVP